MKTENKIRGGLLYWAMIDAISTLSVSTLQFMLPIFVGPYVVSFGVFIINYRTVKKRLKKQQDTHIAALASDKYTNLAGGQKFCASCRTPNAKDVRYCPRCGEKFLE
ncbi:MAG: zinc ribbon domain-containing protein [Candidatus Bathyarchaeota archaeon]|nr:zinc ribbon domain-containing protein [Candidatus Termiticorpusculum sp.]